MLGGWNASVAPRPGEPLCPNVLVNPEPGVAGMPAPGVSLTNIEPLFGKSGTWWEPSPDAVRPVPGVPSVFLLRRQLPLPGPFLAGAGVVTAGGASGGAWASSLLRSVLMRISGVFFTVELTAWNPLPIAGEGDFVCTLSPSTPTA